MVRSNPPVLGRKWEGFGKQKREFSAGLGGLERFWRCSVHHAHAGRRMHRTTYSITLPTLPNLPWKETKLLGTKDMPKNRVGRIEAFGGKVAGGSLPVARSRLQPAPSSRNADAGAVASACVGGRDRQPPGGGQIWDEGPDLDHLYPHAGTFFSVRGFSGVASAKSAAVAASECLSGREIASEGLTAIPRITGHRGAANRLGEMRPTFGGSRPQLKRINSLTASVRR